VVKEVSAKLWQKIIRPDILIITLFFCANQLFAQPEPAKSIPEFTFYTLNDLPFTQKQLKKEGKILFLFFDATCPHCQYEMQQIAAHYKDFINTSFYFVSMDKKQQIQNFINTYGRQLNGKNNVTVLADPNRQFLEKFKPSQFPALYIYNTKHQLLKYWDNSANIDQVMGVIYAP